MQRVRTDDRVFSLLDELTVQVKQVAYGLKVYEFALNLACATAFVSNTLCTGLRHVRRVLSGLWSKRPENLIAVCLELSEQEPVWLRRVDTAILGSRPENCARYSQCDLFKLRGVSRSRGYTQLYIKALRLPCL